MKKRHAGKSQGRQAAAQPRFAGLKSIDDKAAVFAFLILLVVVLFIFDAAADQKAISKGSSLKKVLTAEDAEKNVLSKLIIESREKDGLGFVVENTVDPLLLEEFENKDYEQVKKELGIDADFVIHFEDMEGKVVPIGKKMCIGSSGAIVNGIPCG